MLAQDRVGFSTESLTTQEATQSQANQDRCSPFTTNSYFPFRGSCEVGPHSHSAQHLPYLPGPLLPHKCSPASITHSQTDKGRKRPFCVWLSVEKGTVSFRVLPASFLESHQKHKPSSPHRWIDLVQCQHSSLPGQWYFLKRNEWIDEINLNRVFIYYVFLSTRWAKALLTEGWCPPSSNSPAWSLRSAEFPASPQIYQTRICIFTRPKVTQEALS